MQNANEGEADLHSELTAYSKATERTITEITAIQSRLKAEDN